MFKNNIVIQKDLETIFSADKNGTKVICPAHNRSIAYHHDNPNEDVLFFIVDFPKFDNDMYYQLRNRYKNLNISIKTYEDSTCDLIIVLSRTKEKFDYTVFLVYACFSLLVYYYYMDTCFMMYNQFATYLLPMLK
jgi:hypothetical protein